jgi:DnaJ-class molecular chaperone
MAKVKYCKECKGWGHIWTGKFRGIKNVVKKCTKCNGTGKVK